VIIIVFSKYLKYVVRHKWFVMLACFKVGLYWRGITHDLSKFRPSEFIPYARFFYGIPNKRRDGTGYYKATDTGDKDFDFAWLLHQKRNQHHWQWWMLPEDDGGIKLIEMPDRFILEMVCDWRGAGKAQRNPTSTVEWYLANKDKMQLHPNTIDKLEDLLFN